MKDESQVVTPATDVRGRVRVPGDKSISHRLAMLCGLAEGTSTIDGFLDSEDCLNTLAAVASLGAGVARDGTRVTISGTGGLFSRPVGLLDLGNSGTGMRLLAGLLAGQPFDSRMTGDASLCTRPMGRIKAPLELMGARIELTGEGGCAPMAIAGGDLKGIDYALPVASAQVKSCVLLAGLYAGGETTVREPKPTRDHTERALAAMGAPTRVDGLAISIGGGGAAGRLRAGRWTVPGDFSSAAFWLVAAALSANGELCVEDVGLNPRRTALLDVLVRMGADVSVVPREEGDGATWEPVGDIVVRGSKLSGTVVEGEEIPNLIDELPLVAVLGAMAGGQTVIRDAGELRVKESDRIATTAAALSALGVAVEERPDGMIVDGASAIAGGGVVESRGDHRIAMAAAVLALSASGPVTINDTACIATSYPTFWAHMKQLTRDPSSPEP